MTMFSAHPAKQTPAIVRPRTAQITEFHRDYPNPNREKLTSFARKNWAPYLPSKTGNAPTTPIHWVAQVLEPGRRSRKRQQAGVALRQSPRVAFGDPGSKNLG